MAALKLAEEKGVKYSRDIHEHTWRMMREIYGGALRD